MSALRDAFAIPPVTYEAEAVVRAPAALCWDLCARARNAFREAGEPSFIEGAGLDPFSTLVTSKIGQWFETPATWVEGQTYHTSRIYSRGPLTRGELHMTLQPFAAHPTSAAAQAYAGTATAGNEYVIMRLELKVWPRTLIDSLFVMSGLVSMIPANYIAFAQRVAAERVLARDSDIAAAKTGKAPMLVPRRSSVLSPRELTMNQCGATLIAALQLSRPELRPVAERLFAYLRDGFSDEVLNVRPFALADAWRMPRTHLLEVCLHGVGVFLLTARWVLLCPNCARRTLFSSLKLIPVTAMHCITCRKSINTSLDEAVELRFAVSPTVRAVPAVEVFCPADPSDAQHALYQERFLRSGVRRTFDIVLQNTAYSLRDLISHSEIRLLPHKLRVGGVLKTLPKTPAVAAAGAAGEVLEIDMSFATVPKGSSAYIPGIESGVVSTTYFKPGNVKLRVVSCGNSSLIRLERAGWQTSGVRPPHVAGLALFRSLVPCCLMRRDQKLSAGRLCFACFDVGFGAGGSGSSGIIAGLAARIFALASSREGLIAIDDGLVAVEASGTAVKTDDCAVDDASSRASAPLAVLGFGDGGFAGALRSVLGVIDALSADPFFALARGRLHVSVAAGTAALLQRGDGHVFAGSALYDAVLRLSRSGASVRPTFPPAFASLLLAGDLAIDAAIRPLLKARGLEPRLLCEGLTDVVMWVR